MPSRKKAKSKQLAKPRNPLWADPLMRKGGSHAKPKKALRRAEKVRAIKDFLGS